MPRPKRGRRSRLTKQADEAARDDYFTAWGAWREYQNVCVERRSRYEAMLEQVEAWEPPTAEHDEFKKFMVEQLRTSIDFDTSGNGYPEPVKVTGAEFKADRIERLTRDIEYDRKHIAEEIERTATRNAWLSALRDSLLVPLNPKREDAT